MSTDLSRRNTAVQCQLDDESKRQITDRIRYWSQRQSNILKVTQTLPVESHAALQISEHEIGERLLTMANEAGGIDQQLLDELKKGVVASRKISGKIIADARAELERLLALEQANVVK